MYIRTYIHHFCLTPSPTPEMKSSFQVLVEGGYEDVEVW